VFYLLAGGTRTFSNKKLLNRVLNRVTFTIGDLEVVTGAQKTKVEQRIKGGEILVSHIGADYLAECWCDKNYYTYHRFHPDWDKYGEKAGPLRNTEMVKFLVTMRRQGHKVGAVFFWDGKSKGTKDTIMKCDDYNIPKKVVRYHDPA